MSIRTAVILILLAISAATPALADDCHDVQEVPQEKIARLLAARDRGDVAGLHSLMSEGVHATLPQYGTNTNFYLWAVCQNDVQLFHFLVENTPVENRSARYTLAFVYQHLIVYRPKNFPSVRELIESGKMSLEEPIGHMGVGIVDETPLLAAVNPISPDPDLVAYLLSKGANIKAANRDDHTALHKAASLSGPIFTNLTSAFADSLLKVVDLLLEGAGSAAGALLKAPDRYGRTPLANATQGKPRIGSLEEEYYRDGVENTAQAAMVRKLIAAGSDLNYDTGRMSAFGAAIYQVNTAMVDYLLSFGGNPIGWERFASDRDWIKGYAAMATRLRAAAQFR